MTPPTSERRPAPDFFVIGAYRSGTTSLYRYLRQHPEVYLPLEKEPNFYAVDGNPDASPVLRAMGVGKKLASASIRVSLGRFTTGDEIERAAQRLIDEVSRLRTLSRRR